MSTLDWTFDGTWPYEPRWFDTPLTGGCTTSTRARLLGAGRSDKPDRPEVYTIRRHAQRTEQLLESLDLRDATLVPHDWGMHSLYWAIHHPQRLRGLFILSTIAHRRREEINLPLAIKLFRNRGTGPLLVKRLDPHRSKRSRLALLGELEDGLEHHFRDKPVGIAWGMKDAAFTPAVLEELWLAPSPMPW